MTLLDPGERRGGRHDSRWQVGGRAGSRPELRDSQNDGAYLLLLKLREDPPGGRQVAHLDRLRGRAEQSLDGVPEFGLHLHSLRDRRGLGAGERPLEPSLEERLRPLAKPLPALLELLEEPQAGPALRDLAVGLLEGLLRLPELTGEFADRELSRRGPLVCAGAPGDGHLEPGCRGCGGCGGCGGLPGGQPKLALKGTVPVQARLLVDLVTRGLRAQPRDGAVKLQELELGLLEIPVDPGQLTLGDAELPVVLLVDGVAASEEAKLHLPVLGTRVHLGRHLAQLHLELAQGVPRGLEPVREAGTPDPRQVRRVLSLLLLRPQVVDRLLGVLDALIEAAALRLPRFNSRLLTLEGRPPPVRLGPEARHGHLEGPDGLRKAAVLECTPGKAQVAQPVAQPPVAHGLGSLALEAAYLPGNLAHHIGDPRQVLVGKRQLVQSLPALALVLRDPGRLLEDRAPLLGL